MFVEDDSLEIKNTTERKQIWNNLAKKLAQQVGDISSETMVELQFRLITCSLNMFVDFAIFVKTYYYLSKTYFASISRNLRRNCLRVVRVRTGEGRKSS